MAAATRLRILAIWSILSVAALFLVFDLTSIGELWDDQAHLGREMFHGHIHHVLNRFLNIINVGSIFALIVIAMVISMVRRIAITGAVIVGAFVVTIVLSEVLKRLLPRREFGTMDADLGAFAYNTFPSGHSTIATASVLTLVLLSNARWRPYVAMIGAAWTALIACGVLASGWHRPSDAIAGICIGTAGMSLAGVFVIPRWYLEVSAPGITTWFWMIGVALWMAIWALVIVVVLSPATAPPESRAVLGDFVKSTFLISGCAIGAVLMVAWLTRRVDVAPAPRVHAGR